MPAARSAPWETILRGFVGRWAELDGGSVARMPRSKAAVLECFATSATATRTRAEMEAAPDFTLISYAGKVEVVDAAGAVLFSVDLPTPEEAAQRIAAEWAAREGAY